MKERIDPREVVQQVRKEEGIDIPANVHRQTRETLGIGRHLRTPHLGWVLTKDEAETMREYLIKQYGGN